MRTTGFLMAAACAALFCGCNGELVEWMHLDESAAKLTALRTNGLEDPSGIDTAPTFSWQMACKRRGAKQEAYRIRVFKIALRDGVPMETVWDSGEVRGGWSVGIRYAGKALKPATPYVWQVSALDEMGQWTAVRGDDPDMVAFFDTGLIDPDGWKGSEWITPAVSNKVSQTAAFRKVLSNQKEIANAYWFISGLGVFEAYINGEPVVRTTRRGNVERDVLKPGYTLPRACKHYFTYDVTDMLKTAAGAENVFAALSTSGWWSDAIIGRAGKECAFRGMLIVRYKDGTEARFGTDTTWSAAYAGPVLSAGIYEGEIYDARIGTEWMKGGTLGAEWAAPKVNTEFKGELRAFPGPAIRVREDLELAPKAMYVYKGIEGAADDRFGKVIIARQYKDGDKVALNPGETLVVDLGQNAAGWPCFTLSGAAGTLLTVRHAEMLNDNDGLKSRGNDGPEGSPYIANLRGIFAGIKYTLAGNGMETYRPAFTFFGYRYMGITASAPVAIEKIRGEVVTSVPESGSSLVTGNELVNKLISNVCWGQFSNYLSVPTDCPQRNERQGWTGDTQAFSLAGAYNAPVYGFLSKWMGDMRDCQMPSGAYQDVAPSNWKHGAVTGWSDAGIIVPYNMYKMYGDSSILRDNYASMCRYMDYTVAHKGAELQPYGDWLAYERNDDDLKAVLKAAYYVWDAQMMSEIAAALGNAADAGKFAAMEKTARDWFASQFLSPDGTYQQKYRCQAADIFALYLHLVPDGAAYAATRQDLLGNIKAHGDTLQTGFLGTSILMDALTEANASDMAYTLLLQRNNPSWLYSVDQGATTIWERWNSYVKETGFGDVKMNSFNHYAYGAVSAWMYRCMAGIGTEFGAAGFKRIVLAPHPDKRIGKVACTFESPYGPIVSEWEYRGGQWVWESVVPANAEATLVVPTTADTFTVNGKGPSALTRKGKTPEGWPMFSVGAGSYFVRVKL